MNKLFKKWFGVRLVDVITLASIIVSTLFTMGEVFSETKIITGGWGIFWVVCVVWMAIVLVRNLLENIVY